MSKQAIVYTNSNMCAKKRKATDLLEQHSYEIEEINFLEQAPTVELLENLLNISGLQPTEIIRTGEIIFQALGLSVDDYRDNQAWLELLVQNPTLIERPIVVINGKAVVARPERKILELF